LEIKLGPDGSTLYVAGEPLEVTVESLMQVLAQPRT
jgi:hypothetical protein